MSFVQRGDTPVQRVVGPLGAPERPGGERLVHDFFGQARTLGPGPQGFLVEVVGETTVGAHFHPVDQFQVFFGGPGSWYQRHAIDDLVVHYADAYTTYGPFGTDGSPLQFFTLRPVHSNYTGYMPGARDLLVRRPGRNVHLSLADHLGRAQGPGDADVHTALTDRDGLEVLLLTLGPGAGATLPVAKSPRGEYHCVISGAVEADGGLFARPSLGWFERDDAPRTVMAGPGGLGLLVMRFPADTTADLDPTQPR